MTAVDKLKEYQSDIRPHGRFWQGAAADRLYEAIAEGLGIATQLVDDLADETAPFHAERPALLQWYDYLRRVTCVATPVDTEALRDRALALLAAESTAFPDGLSSVVLAYLKLIELRDDLPLSVIGFSETSAGTPLLLVPFAVDPHAAVIEAWYAPLTVTAEQVECVLAPFIPGVAATRLVTPSAVFRQPAGTTASEIALHWDEMRSVSDATVRRRLTIGGPTIETATLLDIDQRDAQTLDELFPLLGPATSVAAQTIFGSFQRTWAGQTSQVIADVSLVL